MRILNIGAGNRILTGKAGETVINHDIIAHRSEINCVWDLNVTPWIWRDNEFDAIDFISTIEHLEINPIQAMNECWRILKKGGILTIKYPLHSSPSFYDDPTHRHALSEKSLDYLIPGTRYGEDYSFYSPLKWQRLSGGVIKERNYKAQLTPIKS